MIQHVKIKPLIGIDGLTLGIKMSDVLNILGEPDHRKFWDFEDGSCDKTWEYSKLGLELTFSSDDKWLLGNITVESENAELEGYQLIGLDEQEFLKRLQQTDIGPIQLDDDFVELGSRDYVCDRLSLSFWVNDGKLESITIFPEYDENGIVPLWPCIPED